jgi:hypothetical protein
MRDKTPDFGVPVLFYDARLEWVDVGDWREDGHFWTGRSTVSPEGEKIRTVPSEYVTHWQPLVVPDISTEEYERIRAMWAQQEGSRKEGDD